MLIRPWPLNCIRTIPRATATAVGGTLSVAARLQQEKVNVKTLSGFGSGHRWFATNSYPATTTTVNASDLRFGQPVHETHPYLIAAGDLTPNISAHEYHLRRARLASLLPPNSVAIIPSSTLKYRSGPAFYGFHQDSSFLYLTGWLEPEPSLAIIESNGDEDYRFWFFVPEKDPAKEIWSGPRSGTVAARDVWNADEARDITTLEEALEKYIISPERKVYTTTPNEWATTPTPAGVVQKVWERMRSPQRGDGGKMHNLNPYIDSLRLIKSEGEIKNMRIAGRISGRVFNQAMSRRWRSEKELWAFLDYGFRMGGCERDAYLPVVAGGRNACTLHWTRNDEKFREGDMVLVDAGGQYASYPTDISRTWPLSGTFTPAQRDLYEAVLSVQKDCIRALSLPSSSSSSTTPSPLSSSRPFPDQPLTLTTLHNYSKDLLLSHLFSILPPPSPTSPRARLCQSTALIVEALDTLYPHHISHHIGLDVHDCRALHPSYPPHIPIPSRVPLEEGMVVTVEPGVYIPWGDEMWPREWWGTGIRIEDTVVVGRKKAGNDGEGEVGGARILSVEAVKEVVDVEALGRRIAEGKEGGWKYPEGGIWPLEEGKGF